MWSFLVPSIGCILYPKGEDTLEYPGTGHDPLDITALELSEVVELSKAIFCNWASKSSSSLISFCLAASSSFLSSSKLFLSFSNSSFITLASSLFLSNFSFLFSTSTLSF